MNIIYISAGCIYRCLEQPGQCAAYDKCLKGFPGVNPTYGGKLCNPKCEKSDTVMETSLAADVGLYYHFESDPKTGQPHGCAFPDNLDDWQEPDTGFCKSAFQEILI